MRGFRLPVRQPPPPQVHPPRTPGGHSNTPNPNAGRAQDRDGPGGGRPQDRDPPGEVKPAFGSTGGSGGGFMSNLGQGLAFAGGGLIVSDLFGGSALGNLTAGVGQAVGGVGEGLGDLASGVGGAATGLATGVGGAVSGLGQGIGGLAGGVGSGVSSFGANLPYLAMAAGAVALVFLMKK